MCYSLFVENTASIAIFDLFQLLCAFAEWAEATEESSEVVF